MEDVGDGEWFHGFSTPRKETGIKCTQRVLVDCIYTVPNHDRELSEVGVEMTVGGSNIQCVALDVSVADEKEVQ